MEGDLDLAGYALKTTNLEFKEFSSSSYQIVIRDTSTLRDLRLRGIVLGTFVGSALNTYFDTPTVANAVCHFRSRYGGTVTVAKLNVGDFEILKAGDITATDGTKTLSFDTIAEKTVNNGVLIDGVKLKDSIGYFAEVRGYKYNEILCTDMHIPQSALATAIDRNMRYNVSTDTFEIYGAGSWHAH